jgi:hypothetical protein
VFTSVLCGVNKEVKENNNNNKKPNPILAFLLNSELLEVILSSGETSKKDSFLFHKQFKILHKFSIYHQNICSYLGPVDAYVLLKVFQ